MSHHEERPEETWVFSFSLYLEVFAKITRGIMRGIKQMSLVFSIWKFWQLYILKGVNNMGAGADVWKTFLEKNQVKVGIDLAGNEIRDMTLKGENEMNIKETLNKIYGKPAATNESIEEAIDTVTGEEWVWVKGFKGTDKDMRCQDDYQYELGKQFDLDEDIEPMVCSKGFHFCKKLENVFKFYKIGDGNRFFEVEALVKKSDWDSEQKKNRTRNPYEPYGYLPDFSGSKDKYAAKSIRFIRELTVDEVFEVTSDEEVRGWAEEQKKRAMETSIAAVRAEVREFEPCAAGYSPVFSKYIAGDTGRYKTAIAMSSLPDVSMDVKVMAIFMDNQDY